MAANALKVKVMTDMKPWATPNSPVQSLVGEIGNDLGPQRYFRLLHSNYSPNAPTEPDSDASY
jgi:hypothetical protein